MLNRGKKWLGIKDVVLIFLIAASSISLIDSGMHIGSLRRISKQIQYQQKLKAKSLITKNC